jgi:hypothetical protein
MADYPHEQAAMPYQPAQETAGSAIEAARRRHERALLAVAGVTGVAVGRTATGDEAILVYIRDPSVKAFIPAQLDGFPVQTQITGEIDALRNR